MKKNLRLAGRIMAGLVFVGMSTVLCMLIAVQFCIGIAEGLEDDNGPSPE